MFELEEKVPRYHIYRGLDTGKLRLLQHWIESDLANRSRKPEYYPLEYGSQNFLKVNDQDVRSKVLGKFRQYNFFPWNKESDSVFKLCSGVINTLMEMTDRHCREQNWNSFHDYTGLSGECMFNERYFVRIAYQNFEHRSGFLSIHRDPTGIHQYCAPIVSLDRRKSSGLYFIYGDEKVEAQRLLSYGDTIFFDSSLLHGVEHEMEEQSGTSHLLIAVHNYRSASGYLESRTS